MEFLAGVVFAAVVWLWWSKSQRGAQLEASALRNLLELDRVGMGAWLDLEAAIDATPDPDATRTMIALGERSRLREHINNMWTHLDDLSARVNQRADHYELVSGRPAPMLEGRRVADRIMARMLATRDAPSTSHNEVPLGFRTVQPRQPSGPRVAPIAERGAKECPVCGLISPSSAARCDCGASL